MVCSPQCLGISCGEIFQFFLLLDCLCKDEDASIFWWYPPISSSRFPLLHGYSRRILGGWRSIRAHQALGAHWFDLVISPFSQFGWVWGCGSGYWGKPVVWMLMCTLLPFLDRYFKWWGTVRLVQSLIFEKWFWKWSLGLHFALIIDRWQSYTTTITIPNLSFFVRSSFHSISYF